MLHNLIITTVLTQLNFIISILRNKEINGTMESVRVRLSLNHSGNIFLYQNDLI